MAMTSLRVSPEKLDKVKKAFKRTGLTQQEFASEVDLSTRQPIGNFLKGKNVKHQVFKEICFKLDLDWQEVADLGKDNEPEIQEIENTIFKEPNFLGREEDIANINNLVNEGKKVILIKAEGGIGKTTLAENWFKIQRCDYLKLNVGTTSQTIKSLEEWLISQLKETFKITPAQNFGNMLDQLTTQLHKQKIGILIDNLEPALKNGKFIEPHQNYVDLLEILANQNIQGITIITSREQIYEHKIFRLSTFHNYDLEGLNEKTWKEYFENKKIIIDNDSLNAMWRNYGGNAEAMSLLAADILKESKGDLKAYWQDNSEDLLRHRSLEQLVHSQFDKLKNDNSQAYNLLCRLGVYPNNDVNLPEMWLSCLLWDVPKNKRKRVIDNLLSRCLIKKQDNYYSHPITSYYLHPITKAKILEDVNLIDEFTFDKIELIKAQIDEIIAPEGKIQAFLRWLNNKSMSVQLPCQQSVIRSFYFDCEINSPLDLYLYDALNRGFDFQSDMDMSIDYEISNILYFIKEHIKYHNPYIYVRNCMDRYDEIENYLENDIEFGSLSNSGNFIPMDYGAANALKTIINNIICYISLQIDVNKLGISPEFKKVFQELKQKLPDLEGDENTYNQWWQVNGQNWMKQLREVLIKYRNIAHDWQFNDKEKQLLENYYHVNILLIDCINSNCRVSHEMRSHIEDTLLLPIEEIEKRPFKYQE